MVNSAFSSLLDGLFPQDCLLCGLASGRDLPLCLPCEGDIPRNQSCCRRCAIPLPPRPAGTDRVCGNCLQWPPPFNRVVAPWLYTEHLAHLIHRWKYGHEQHLSRMFAALWLQHAPSDLHIDLLVPVPLHWSRRWMRGFNQAELLCRQLRSAHPTLNTAPIGSRLVRRTRPTAAQSGMNAQQRAGNLRGAFTVREPCDNLRIALVDDVFTTGATAAAVASALTAAGASHVEVWCLARTPAPGR